MALTPTDIETTSPAAEPAHDHAHDHSHEVDLAPGLHQHNHSHGPALNPELTREIDVEVPADEVSKAFRSVVKRYQKLARIPGFRAGKVPESLIKTRFAQEVRQEVLESLVGDRFRKALDAQQVTPASQPQIVDMQLFDGQPLKFKAAFEVLPEFDVTGYDSEKVEKADTTLTEEEYQAELIRVLDTHATVEPVEEDRPLVDGDWAEIEFKGEFKPVAETVTEEGATAAEEDKAEPITGEDVLLEVGGANTLPAFNEALRGAKPGQELTFEVSYPADFGEPRLANQTVSYDVTVKAIKRKIYPERNAEFASQLGSYESWGDFETKLREMAQGRKSSSVENRAKDIMLEKLIERFQFPVPESFVQQQIEARLDRGLRALAQQGMTPDDMRKLDFVRLREAQRDQAINEVKASMILDKIAAAEGVTVADDEMERELMMLSIQSREPLDVLRERLTNDGSLDRIREQMRREKTGTVLYEKLAS
jgi:trigger factor